jgi:hypothetical protein
MFKKGPAIGFSALAVVLTACGGGVRTKGSAAIASFLATVQGDDRAAFEARIDRTALRADLTGQLLDLAKVHAVDVGEGPSEFAVDRMISLPAVRATAAQVAPGWPATPSAAEVVPHLKARDGRHICLEQATTQRCLLSFAQEKGAWKLVGMRFTPPAPPRIATSDPIADTAVQSEAASPAP